MLTAQCSQRSEQRLHRKHSIPPLLPADLASKVETPRYLFSFCSSSTSEISISFRSEGKEAEEEDGEEEQNLAAGEEEEEKEKEEFPLSGEDAAVK